jgi:hypothetical protein
MLSFVIGVILLVSAISLLLYCRPRDGKVHRLATLPLIETAVPLAVTSGLALGGALVVAGVFW